MKSDQPRASSHRWYRWFPAVLERVQGRFRRARPGSVLILVVALLTLLALMGTAYLSTTRIDRAGVQQAIKTAGLDEQATSQAQLLLASVQDWIAKDDPNLTTGLVVDPTDPNHS